ncbi:DUF3857 domain-containing protein [Flavobacterium sp. H122]|uniref:DUF3857 domain-containing protein n=1 Tax=Flavobacterium sp. H122 TaxID=2529860 RepID=UPI0010AB397D|nr:DUF3857 domain-containing protein [Flavobacterium sp. H122]
MKLNTFLLVSIFFTTILFSQNTKLSVESIPQELKENANSVIRDQLISVEIKSVSNMLTTTHKTITVLNERGLRNLDVGEQYDESWVVNKIQAIIYNAQGYEIKKLKRKDFFDISASGGSPEITDTRILRLNYTPTQYPFTIVYESEVETINTAFIPRWYPLDDYYESVEKTEYKIKYPVDLGFRYKLVELDKLKIDKEESDNELHFKLENLSAEKPEDLSAKKFGCILFGTNVFSLEGVEGKADSWKEFGRWMNEELLKNTNELPEITKQKIRALTAGITDPIEKARIVYDYVQNKTRYVSIQLGIGGWKPMLAKDVDRLGYGDCKGLSNYTRALLDVVGVTSYYTIIYGGYKENIEPDFVSMQGNHAVLAIPYNNKLVFLECTSQTQAFGFEGDFTDDRYALLIKPEGGEVVKTNGYFENLNSQMTKGKITMNEDGKTLFNVEIKYKGIQYEYANKIEKLVPEKITENFKERYSNITALQMDSYKLNNDKKSIEFTEQIKFRAENVLKFVGNEKILNINLLNVNQSIPQRYRVRKTDFEIQYGFVDEDDITFEIDKKHKIGFLPEKVKIETKYGIYESEIVAESNNVLRYKRRLFVKKGKYNSAEYDEYRKFREEIAKYDNSKIILN